MSASGRENKLKKQIFLWRSIALLLCLILVVFVSDNSWRMLGDYIDDHFRSGRLDTEAPFQKEIKKIIDPLRYSGVERLLKPNVWVSVDFEKKTWTIHNLHVFDANGSLLLEGGRSGVCQELAAYVFEKIKPLLGEKYDVSFLVVSESGFFNFPQGTHVALCITPKNAGYDEACFLDPTFHRYGPIGQFDDYAVLRAESELEIFKQKNRDVEMNVDFSTPLKIKDNYVIGFVVEDVGGRFDRENFSFGLSAMRKHRYIGRLIFALKMVDGKEYQVEDEGLSRLLFSPKEYQALRYKIREMFDRIMEENQAPERQKAEIE